MALAQAHGGILGIQAGNTGFSHLITILIKILRLSATAYAASRTGHDLYKMILLITASNVCQQLFRIGCTIGNSHLHLQVAYLQFRLLDALVAPD